MNRILLLTLLLLSTTACINIRKTFAPDKMPSAGYRYLDQIAYDPFDSVGSWRTYDGGDDLWMNVEAGVYRIDLSTRQIVWTQSTIQHEDVIIEATVTQRSDYDYNAFGVACRLDPANSGRGYYFLISGDGHYTIRWNNGRSLDDIIQATPSDVIKRGQATNTIRAICIDDYLALWINDEFVAEARDNRASQGVVGLSGVMNYDNRDLIVEFDDLKVWDGILSSSEA